MAQTKGFFGDFFPERNIKNGSTVKRVKGLKRCPSGT